ncbi:regulator of G-protein signaling 1-like isoform X2 [Histomonas meleagridis]|uniref:regulator of G-protein signaling 1-like isoform X2 n=1 Tax=Histomonas meleagridis TaxID=135588 RepID=UPI00355977E7|nr:regulator of G-protein signaling 1-like isoform X2 [Histomonas meleagridis]KAH0800552.1 regulator of G-protein signaling 1-like isoform X2 [Histomonas meleagridis]
MLPLHFFPYPVRSLRFIIIYQINKSEVTEGEKGQENCASKLIAWLKAHNKIISDTAFLILLWIIIGIAFLAGLYRCIKLPANHWGVASQTSQNIYWITILIFWVIVQVLLWIAVYFIRKIHDELKYNIELTSIGICWLVLIGLYIVLGWVEGSQNKSTIVPPIFANVLCIISMLLSFGMPIQLAYVKPPEVKLGMERLDKLEELLKDKEASKMFIEFVNKRGCPEGYLFYREIEKFRKISSQEELNEAFARIKKTYIEQNATMRVNIADHIVKEIGKVKTPTADVFNDAFIDNLRLMKTDLFPQFKCSKQLKDYAKKLRAKGDLII